MQSIKFIVSGIGFVVLIQIAMSFVFSLALLFVHVSPQGLQAIVTFMQAYSCLMAGFLLGRNAR